jgi:hypothetical protein
MELGRVLDVLRAFERERVDYADALRQRFAIEDGD